MDLARLSEIAIQHQLTDKQVEKLKLDTEDAVFRCLTSPDGKDLVAMLEASYLYRQSFVPGRPDESAFREGERSVVLGLLETIASVLSRQAINAVVESGKPDPTQTHAEGV